MSTHSNMFAKDDDDDEHVLDFGVFPPLPLLLEISADFERVQNVTVDVVPFSPPPGSNAILVDEVVDHPSDTGSGHSVLCSGGHQAVGGGTRSGGHREAAW